MKLTLFNGKRRMAEKVLLIFALVFAAGTAVKVFAFTVSTSQVSSDVQGVIDKTNKTDEQGDEGSKPVENEYVKVLKKRSIFVPAEEKPQAPVCMGIMGDSALFDKKLYKVGEDFQGAKIVAISPADVTIMWEDEEKKLIPFSVAVKYDAKPAVAAPQAQSGGGPAVPVVAGPPAGPVPGQMPRGGRGDRGGGMMGGMSMDQMQQMRDRYMNASPEERDRMRSEMRSRFGRGDRSRRQN